jgi:transposase
MRAIPGSERPKKRSLVASTWRWSRIRRRSGVSCYYHAASVVERDFAWASRFRRLVKDYERLPDTLAGLYFVAFACLVFRQQATGILGTSP